VGDQSHGVIGQSVPRTDARAKVSGRATYLVDMELPGMLEARVLRSPLPHARIARLDTTRAEALPGVVVLTSRDFEAWGLNPCYGPVIRDQPVVAEGVVRFAGEPVAAVAAPDGQRAEEALQLIEVEYEELPPTLDPREAMAPGARLVHERSPATSGAFADLRAAVPGERTNACGEFKLRRGNVALGFQQAHLIVEGEFSTPTIQHVPLEPHAAIARVHADGRIELWANTQTPSVVRGQLADLFQVPVSKVRIQVPYLGGGYGAKAYAKVEPLAIALARKAGRPVRVALTNHEQFLTVVRHAGWVRLRMGFAQDGRLTAVEGLVYLDTGAYADIGPRTCKFAAYSLAGPYSVPNAHLDGFSVYTNRVPSGAFRGFGVPQAIWATEQLMDEAAHKLGLDPLEIRLRNLPEQDYETVTGDRPGSAGIREALLKVAEAIGWNEPTADRRGLGLAVVNKTTITPSLSNAVVTLSEDGSVAILTSSVEIGQGSETVLRQVCAAELGVPLDWVRIVQPDTDVTPYDQSTTASRTTFSMGNAIVLASREVREQLFQTAADLLEASPADLAAADGRVFVRGAPNRSASFAQVMRHRFSAKMGTLVGRGELLTQGVLDPETGQGTASAFWYPGAFAAEVEVDPETGQVRVLRAVAASDVGRAINPQLCHQQNEGSVTMGLGQALMEELVFADGQPLNANLAEYKLPSFKDFPPFQSILVEQPDPNGPFGARGIAEAVIPLVAPAIGNALNHATGIRLHSLPITAEKVRNAMRQVAEGRTADRPARPEPFDRARPEPVEGLRTGSVEGPPTGEQP
jgi:CO/xanthine dehydrogenase Mo-binding subunit